MYHWTYPVDSTDHILKTYTTIKSTKLSQHHPSLQNNFQKSVQFRLSTASSLKDIFKKHKSKYVETLEQSDQKINLVFVDIINNWANKPKHHKRNSKLFKSSLLATMSKLLSEEFSETHPWAFQSFKKVEQIFNKKNNVNNCWTLNINQYISWLNNIILNVKTSPPRNKRMRLSKKQNPPIKR